MEALAGLSLASNVVQFIHFTSELVSATGEIADSVDGATQRVVEVEKCYERLEVLRAGFQRQRRDASAGTEPGDLKSGLGQLAANVTGLTPEAQRELSSHVRSMEDLADECGGLCEQLLDTVRKLQLEGPQKRPLKSFQLALKTAWNMKKIQSLEDRVDRFWRTISRHFLPLLSLQQLATIRTLNALREESQKLQADQVEKLNDLSSTLQAIKDSLSQHSVGASNDSQQSQFSTPLLTPTQSFQRLSQAATLNGSASFETSDWAQNRPTEEDIAQLERGIKKLALAQTGLSTVAKEQAFLRSLDFATRTNRRDEISIAHRNTFLWALDNPNGKAADQPRVPELENWLADGDGIFWLYGKAGSGKSTLMKMIASHDKTEIYLDRWANAQQSTNGDLGGYTHQAASDRKAIVAEYYFWKAGEAMQKSQQGLVRSILYDVFRMCPDQIPEFCPSRFSTGSAEALSPAASDDWPVQELLDTLERVAKDPTFPARCCVFIDGIDEFEPREHEMMTQFLTQLSRSPNFKLFVSSRPLNIFEDTLGLPEFTSLCIHDQTLQDIRSYAQSRMEEHHKWREPYFASKDMADIIDIISERAYGVFLWVFLVTKSLRDGLFNSDRLVDLHKRLDSLPTDLEAFFEHMLGMVEPIYHEHMARMLQVALNAAHPLSLQFYYMYEFEDENPDYATEKQIDWRMADGIDEELDLCRRRINARCGGLLEIKGQGVEFLHRTVRDFLQTPRMKQFLEKKAGQDFKVCLSTLRVFVFLFRFWSQANVITTLAHEKPSWNWKQALKFANGAIEESPEEAIALLDYIQGTYERFLAPNDPALVIEPHSVFLTELLHAGVDKYVCANLEEGRWLFESLSGSPLCLVLGKSEWSERHLSIVRSFLTCGIGDSASDVGPRSPWASLVLRVSGSRNGQFLRTALESSLFSEFLRLGAPRDATVGDHNRLPCTHLLLAMIRYKDAHKISDQCFSLINAFLEADNTTASLQIRDIVRVASRELRRLGIDTELARQGFIGTLLWLVIQKGVEMEVGMDLMVPQISKFVVGNVGTALVDMIQHGAESVHFGAEPGRLRRQRRE